MANALVTQSAIRGLLEGSNALVAQSTVRAVYNNPADAGRIAQVAVRSLAVPEPVSKVSQALVRVLCRGRIEDPRVRAWTYSLDGHDFYVLRLGEIETLVYDTLSEEWYTWGTDAGILWRVNTGHNWLGGELLSAVYGSNVLVGDDTTGRVYFLNPDQDYDTPSSSAGENTYFTRRASGQVPMKGYSKVPCYGVEVFGSIGFGTAPPPFNTVTLEYSDDSGVTYVTASSIAVDTNQDTRLFWRSLGSIKNPGRIFRVTDSGALRRIDSMEMLDGTARP